MSHLFLHLTCARSATDAAVSLCRYAGTLEAMYVEHEERQKERMRAIREGGGAGSVAERVRQARLKAHATLRTQHVLQLA